MTDPQAVLSSVFGFDSFRNGQKEIVDAVIAGENVLSIMPTGAGKSLCFQLPALCLPGVTVVISPLIALMRDQVRGLRESGVVAGALTSANSDAENDRVYADIQSGTLKLLYLAPERLASVATQRLLRSLDVAFLAVDEAHCVSQWGHDFRPDYLKIGALRQDLGVPLAAFTATADEETRTEIVARLFGDAAPKVFLGGFDRPNIHLAFAPKYKPRDQLLAFAEARRGQSGIIYCGTRAKTETLASALSDLGHTALAYHGGMGGAQRSDVETEFQRQDGLIVVATVAFGMGIDKPDIRWVAHADLPKSVEAYYQEIGRAGRDGAPAETLTLFSADDIRFRRSQIDEGLAPAERRSADHGRLNALLGLADAITCRRQALLMYFGEKAEPCGHCDICDKPVETFAATEPVRMALSAVLRCDERFGAGHLIEVLRGTLTEKVQRAGHDTLPTFGIGAHFNQSDWQSIFRQISARDWLRPDPERHGALRITAAARPVLRGEVDVTFRKDRRKSAKSASKAFVSDEDAPVLAALKACRRALAEARSVPAYVIFPDRTLIEMAEKRPENLDQLAKINGVGAKKLARYGDTFLKALTGDSDNLHPRRRTLAGRTEGQTYDKLLFAQANLVRGSCGTLKPLSCSASLLARVAKLKSSDLTSLSRLLGDRRTERFGDAFLEILADG